MDIIISEKAIAGERIANILADTDVKQKQFNGARVFEFEWKGKDIRLIPLRGHISDVDFPKSFSRWKGIDVRDLINADIEMNDSLWEDDNGEIDLKRKLPLEPFEGSIEELLGETQGPKGIW